MVATLFHFSSFSIAGILKGQNLNMKWFLSFLNVFSEISDARNIRLYSQTKLSNFCSIQLL